MLLRLLFRVKSCNFPKPSIFLNFYCRYMTPLLSGYSLSPGKEGRFAYMTDGERAVVEWRDVHTSKERKVSFQVVMIFGSGDIHFVYRLGGIFSQQLFYRGGVHVLFLNLHSRGERGKGEGVQIPKQCMQNL